jgi:hypothetical protein
VVEVGDQWEASQNIEMARFQPILQIVAHVLELVEGEGSAVRPSALPHPFVDHSKSLHRAKHCVAKVVQMDHQWEEFVGVHLPKVCRWLEFSLARALLSWARWQVALLVEVATSRPAQNSPEPNTARR